MRVASEIQSWGEGPNRGRVPIVSAALSKRSQKKKNASAQGSLKFRDMSNSFWEGTRREKTILHCCSLDSALRWVNQRVSKVLAKALSYCIRFVLAGPPLSDRLLLVDFLNSTFFCHTHSNFIQKTCNNKQEDINTHTHNSVQSKECLCHTYLLTYLLSK